MTPCAAGIISELADIGYVRPATVHIIRCRDSLPRVPAGRADTAAARVAKITTTSFNSFTDFLDRDFACY
jgi:hypothetical protein